MTRGGKREGAGRPFGTKKEPTVMLQRRVKKEWIPLIDAFITKLKNASKKMKAYKSIGLENSDNFN